VALNQERDIAIAQALADILATLDPVYNPQSAVLQGQLDALPGQQAADKAGLDATKNNAFSSIASDANAKGMAYSGLPIDEQAKYTGGTYLPAVANLSNTYASKSAGLQTSLAQVKTDEMKQAYTTQQQQQAADDARAIADRAAAAAKAAANPGLSWGGGGNAAPAAVNPIDAATGYAKVAKAQLLSAGGIQPFARERVRADLISQFGLSDAAANQIIYNNVFPDNWAGGGAPIAPPQSLQKNVGLPNNLKFGGL